jgi:putative endonuclease
MDEHRYYVYIVASRSHTLYIGFTSSLEARIQQHKEGTCDGFSTQYNCNRLVYYETHDDVYRAISREKQLKRWSRSKKLALIERFNPAWADLSEHWGKPITPWRKSAATTE